MDSSTTKCKYASVPSEKLSVTIHILDAGHVVEWKGQDRHHTTHHVYGGSRLDQAYHDDNTKTRRVRDVVVQNAGRMTNGRFFSLPSFYHTIRPCLPLLVSSSLASQALPQHSSRAEASQTARMALSRTILSAISQRVSEVMRANRNLP